MKKIRIKEICIITLSLVVLLGILSIAYAIKNESNGSTFGKSYKKNVVKEKGKDKIVATINDENIYQSEVNLLKWQYDNSPDGMKPYGAEDNNTATITKNVAKQKLILAEAKTNKITLTDIEIAQIKKNIDDSFAKNPIENQDFIDNLGMTKDEVSKILLEMQTNSIIEARYMGQKILPKITENKLQTDDKDLMNKVDDYQKFNKDVKSNQDGKAKAEKLKGLNQAYKDSLFVKANFKALN